jgi:YD repeat-containing protein
MYFVIQPGGAKIESVSGKRLGAQIVYPNWSNRPPGAQTSFVYYDPTGPGWTAYGTGTVSASRREIDPARHTEFYSFSGAGDEEAYNPPPITNPPAQGCQTNGTPASGADADPVDCATGLFVYNHVDLAVPDTIPIIIQRTYQSSDTTPRNFGIGFTFNYALWLYDTNGPVDTDFTTLNLVLPNGSLVPFTRTAQSAPTGLTDLQMAAAPTPTEYTGAMITYDPNRGYLIMTTKDGTQYMFNAADGRYLREVIKPNGQALQVTTALTQTGENYPVVTLTSPNGRWVQIQYVDAEDPLDYPAGTSEISSITDDSGRTVSYSYDSAGRLVSVTYPDGGVEQFTYDGTSDRIISDIMPNGQTRVTNHYDSNERVDQQTLANGGVYKFAYTTNPNGQVTETDVTDPRGYVREILFNDAGYVTSSTSASGTPLAQTMTFQRDPNSNLITSVTDPLGRVTNYTYDGNGNVTSVTRMAGTSETATYSYTYTPQYDELASATDPLNHTVSFGYDNMGDLTSVTDALNEVTAFSYNAAGLPATITNPLGKVTTLSYSAGALTSITDPLNRTTSIVPNAIGLTSAVTDPAGNQTVYERDAMGRVASIVDATGGVTKFGYDLDGNMTSVTDANAHVQLFGYNNMDRLANRIDQLNQSESWTYDQDGNIVNYTDRKGQQRVITYDALDRASQVEYVNATGGVESTIGYTYDAANRMTVANDSAGGPLSVGYDDFDRISSVTTANGSFSSVEPYCGFQWRHIGSRIAEFYNLKGRPA